MAAPANPVLSLETGFELRPDGIAATHYDGPIHSYSTPSRDLALFGPLVEEPLAGIGYVMLLSYTCDYAEPAKDHPYRLVAQLWNLYALPNDNGLRGLVWKHPESERCPAVFYPVPELPEHFGASFVNLRQTGLLHRELLPPTARVASLSQPAKHLLWRKHAFFHTRVWITEEQLAAVDAQYASPSAMP